GHAGIHSPRLTRIVDDVHVLMGRVILVGSRAHLGIASEEGVARHAGAGEVAAVTGDVAWRRRLILERIVLTYDHRRSGWATDILRVVRGELRHYAWCREGLAAVGGFDIDDGIQLTAL